MIHKTLQDLQIVIKFKFSGSLNVWRKTSCLAIELNSNKFPYIFPCIIISIIYIKYRLFHIFNFSLIFNICLYIDILLMTQKSKSFLMKFAIYVLYHHRFVLSKSSLFDLTFDLTLIRISLKFSILLNIEMINIESDIEVNQYPNIIQLTNIIAPKCAVCKYYATIGSRMTCQGAQQEIRVSSPLFIFTQVYYMRYYKIFPIFSTLKRKYFK